MKLKDLAAAIPAALRPLLVGSADTSIDSLSYDSRQVFQGVCFVCLKGEKSDGHEFRVDAAHRGAAAFIVDRDRVKDFSDLHFPFITVVNTRAALPYVASAFYNDPTSHLNLVGITGTNGKTTVSFMLAAIWSAAGVKSGVIGTIGASVNGTPFPTNWTVSTTPEALDLQQFFAQLVRDHVTHVALEVTSIAIDQERTAACHFRTAIFTNLTQDHLDYHGTMISYEAAKTRLFAEYPSAFEKDFVAVINADDPAGVRIAERTKALGIKTVTYSSSSTSDVTADYKVTNINAKSESADFTVQEGHASYPIHLPVGGLFNISNALAAIAAARVRNVAIDTLQRGLAELGPIPGRFEHVPSPGKQFHIFVDYAHTPDGLENVLKSARALSPKRLVVVFGCGGNRDRTKRPKMGKIAAEIADVVIVTSDNPRNEEPEFIVSEILKGIEGGKENSKVKVEVDRHEAIRMAVCDVAAPGDIIVVAGKGHETYQIVKDKTLPFDDRLVVAEALA
jgi:UDP-N-acetylmuramoyl-L-alanyl-D-glutamate--2,6-diaminopimelate ligase